MKYLSSGMILPDLQEAETNYASWSFSCVMHWNLVAILLLQQVAYSLIIADKLRALRQD